MHYQPTFNVSDNRGFNGGQRAHLASHTYSADLLRPAGPRSTQMETRNSANERVQWTPDVVVDPHRMGGPDMPFAVHGVVTDPGDMPPSMEYRMAAMRSAFAATGGLLTVGELADGNDPHSRARFAQIAKGIATREIIGFMWQSEPWVPMFQFEAGSRLLPRRALQPLFKLLVPLYDAWEMANWFARSNPWLSGLRPVDQCTNHLEAVLDVAQLEHYIATGQASQQNPVAHHTRCN